MRTLAKHIWLLLLVWLPVIGVVLAADTGTTRVLVKDDNGTPISGAQITCYDPDGNMVHETNSGQEGLATISLPEGNYLIVAERVGSQNSGHVEIRAGWETPIDIRLTGSVKERPLGAFPMSIHLGPPTDASVMLFTIRSLPDTPHESTIEFEERGIPIGQLSRQLHGIGQSISLSIEPKVPHAHIISVLDTFYRLYRTEQVYLSLTEDPGFDFLQPLSPTTSLTVILDDFATGNPRQRIPEATVTVTVTDQKTKDYTQETDEVGMVNFPGIPVGQHILTIAKQGYHTENIPVVIQVGTSRLLFVHLLKSDLNPADTHFQASHIRSSQKVPRASNQEALPASATVLFLGSSRSVLLDAERVGRMVSSAKQMQTLVGIAAKDPFFIAATRDVESRWVLGLLQLLVDAQASEFRFVVQ